VEHQAYGIIVGLANRGIADLTFGEVHPADGEDGKQEEGEE
jgi:hypothetical protein